MTLRPEYLSGVRAILCDEHEKTFYFPLLTAGNEYNTDDLVCIICRQPDNCDMMLRALESITKTNKIFPPVVCMECIETHLSDTRGGKWSYCDRCFIHEHHAMAVSEDCDPHQSWAPDGNIT